MFNARNNFSLTGRVAQESKVITNSDGSKKVFAKLAVQDNYRTGGEFGTEFIELEKFVGKDAQDYIERLNKGDLVIAEGHISCKPYEKDGEMVYPAPKLITDKITPLARAKGEVLEEAPEEE